MKRLMRRLREIGRGPSAASQSPPTNEPARGEPPIEREAEDSRRGSVPQTRPITTLDQRRSASLRPGESGLLQARRVSAAATLDCFARAFCFGPRDPSASPGRYGHAGLLAPFARSMARCGHDGRPTKVFCRSGSWSTRRSTKYTERRASDMSLRPPQLIVRTMSNQIIQIHDVISLRGMPGGVTTEPTIAGFALARSYRARRASRCSSSEIACAFPETRTAYTG